MKEKEKRTKLIAHENAKETATGELTTGKQRYRF